VLSRSDLPGETGKLEYSEQDIGETEGVYTMQKIKYTNPSKDIRDAIKQSEIIEDFLPPPDHLVFKEENVKITLELSSQSVRLFKRYAKSKGFKYQRMIRNLVDQYANKVFSH
jgi:predicted DNA binding CopG/RHH family protein